MDRKNRISLALAVALATATLAPLSSLAGTKALFRPAECGSGVRTDYVREDGAPNKIANSNLVLKVDLPSGNDPNKLGGLKVDIHGVRHVPQNTVEWRNLTFRCDPGGHLGSAISAVLYFDLPNNVRQKRVIKLSSFPGTPHNLRPGWQTFSLKNSDLGGIGKGAILSNVWLLANGQFVLQGLTVKFGNVQVGHTFFGDIDNTTISPIETSACGQTNN